MKNYRELPKLRDSITYIYIEHANIEQDNLSVVIVRNNERIPIPVATITCLILGPGTTVTHSAIKTATDNGCLIAWCGENMQKFYASGLGETKSADNLLKQAMLCMNSETHLEVAKRMYERRFPKLPEKDYTIQQLRGLEGIRVKEAYKLASRKSGVKWNGRNYKTIDWDASDSVNKALSEGNSMLYAICSAAIISLGFSTGLGFVHTGKMLSFTYDIADLYKAETTIPAAFEAVKLGEKDLLQNVRIINRRYFENIKLLKRIPEDIAWIFDVKCEEQIEEKTIGELWDENGNTIEGGVNWANEAEE